MGHRFVIVVGEVMLGDLTGRGLPYPIVGHYVIEGLFKVFDPVGLPYHEWMQGNAHHPPALGSFLVQHVELVFAALKQVIALEAPPEDRPVVNLARIGNGDHLAGLYLEGYWLVVVHPVGVVYQTRLGHQVRGTLGYGAVGGEHTL